MATCNITIKSVYGRNRAYPICPVAKTFANMLGKVTLDRVSLKHIESLGFVVTCNFNQFSIDNSQLD